MITAISAIAVFLLLITVHELGHFVAAKLVGIKVLEFAIGMGPAIFKRQKGETLYSVRILPIGGYCKMEGEDEESSDERAFVNKKPWQKLIVLVSGAFMNIFTGFMIFLVIMSMISSIYIPVAQEIIEGSPAHIAGLEAGDRITRINGVKINIIDDLEFEMSRYIGGEITVEYKRNGKKGTVSLTPVKDEEGRNIMGIVKTIKPLTFASRISEAFFSTINFAKIVLVSFGDLISGRYSFRDVSGPVGIVKEIGAAAKTGGFNLLFITTLITINLGVFNLLPFPALDGGRVVFILIEAIRRKRLPAEKEGMVHFIGFVLLILLMIAVTGNDFGRIFGFFKE
ncbi:MAG: Regulator of sigma-W protease RasP [Firmicutes bacterium ADurb.Bin193]|nr:MAG: Regulator of sigma-W protease RasP [Firmicutes bacterium ADurb.Bin193]